MRIFLDANILFSAAKSDGAVRELLRRAKSAGHVLCVDPYVIEEARRNLESKSPQAVALLHALVHELEVSPLAASQLSKTIAPQLAAKDRPVLAAAIRLGCSVLVTGDRTHFGKLFGRIVEGVTIHSPRSLAETLQL